MNGQFVPQSIDVLGIVAQQKNLRHEFQLLGGQTENIAFIRQDEKHRGNWERIPIERTYK